ncbi:MAG: hypothetical protein H0X12_11060 [Nocardioides sp.]|nr:hypothetical protein [Nocardioides sp.]
MSAERIRVPALLSSSVTMWLSVVAAGAGVVGVVAWALLTQPLANQVAAFVLAVVLVGLIGGLATRRTWLDPSSGLLVREVAFVWRRPLAWSDATVLRPRDNHAGQVMLEVRGAGRRTSTYLPLLAVDAGGDRSQPPGFLRVLADQIEVWAPSRGAVVKVLHAQADHLETGGAVRDSPLARAYLARAR